MYVLVLSKYAKKNIILPQYFVLRALKKNTVHNEAFVFHGLRAYILAPAFLG